MNRVVESLRIYIHSILYCEKCYPSEWFIKSDKFVDGYECKDINVRGYIDSICDQLKRFVSGVKVVLMIFDGDSIFTSKPLKQFLFELRRGEECEGEKDKYFNHHTFKILDEIKPQHNAYKHRSFVIVIQSNRENFDDSEVNFGDECIINIYVSEYIESIKV